MMWRAHQFQCSCAVSARALYGGTFTLFNETLPQCGIEVRFIDAEDPENFVRAMDENTRAFYCETVSNVCELTYESRTSYDLYVLNSCFAILFQQKPALEICDLEVISNLAHSHGLPVIVDSTFSTPYLTKPFEFGCDIIVTSCTKWIGGHGSGYVQHISSL